MRRTAKTVRDRRQCELFEPPPWEDLLRAYYDKMRRHGMTLSINPETGQITVSRASGPIGAWAASPPSELRDRIVVDLLRAEHGIEPPIERQTLDGGAELVRLPVRRDPALEPPVRKPRPRKPGRGGAA